MCGGITLWQKVHKWLPFVVELAQECGRNHRVAGKARGASDHWASQQSRQREWGKRLYFQLKPRYINGFGPEYNFSNICSPVVELKDGQR